MILGTICARGGSKGVPGKNIRDLCGKPLIAYSIETALKCNRINKLIVSTDDPQIAEVSKKYGADVPFIRPKELATDKSAKIPVIKHALEFIEKNTDEKIDFVVDLDATSPIRTTQDIERCISEIEKDPETDLVITVTDPHKNPYFNMVEPKGNYVKLVKQLDEPIVSRQNAPPVFSMNASIYVYRPKFLKSGKGLFGGNVKAVKMDELSSVDIDRELDFQFIKFLIDQKVVEL